MGRGNLMSAPLVSKPQLLRFEEVKGERRKRVGEMLEVHADNSPGKEGEAKMEGGAKYFGERTAAGCSVYVKYGPKWVRLSLQINVTKDSPADFDWGYMCRGAAQLALAILVDHLKNEVWALELCEDFVFKVVARLDRNQWLLAGEEIDEAIKETDQRLETVA